MVIFLLRQVLEINLSELQKSLDAQGIQLVDNQKESVVGRKILADKTKGNLAHENWGPALTLSKSSRSFQRKIN